FDEEDTEWRGETKERDIFEQKKIGSKGSDILDWRVRVVVEIGEDQIVKTEFSDRTKKECMVPINTI
ncbi:MAG: hypothetical protein EZS28_034357, partial [Streblomastix strix]